MVAERRARGLEDHLVSHLQDLYLHGAEQTLQSVGESGSRCAISAETPEEISTHHNQIQRNKQTGDCMT